VGGEKNEAEETYLILSAGGTLSVLFQARKAPERGGEKREVADRREKCREGSGGNAGFESNSQKIEYR